MPRHMSVRQSRDRHCCLQAGSRRPGAVPGERFRRLHQWRRHSHRRRVFRDGFAGIWSDAERLDRRRSARMNATIETSLPTIDAPASGMRFEDWMPAANVFDAIARTQQRWGDRTALTFLGSDPDAPPRKLTFTQLVEGIARTANAFRSFGLRRG